MTESYSDILGWRGDHMLPSGDRGRLLSYSPYLSATNSPYTQPSPQLPPALLAAASSALAEQEKYLNELLAERLKLTPFTPVLHHVYRLLNEEISRLTTVLRNASVLGLTGVEHSSPLASSRSSLAVYDADGWPSTFHPDASSSPSSVPTWMNPQGGSSGIVVKKTMRVDIPVDKFPYYNFVGRLLGPRGNSLKRVEASTECRVRIRGHGSIKDPSREEMMRGKPGNEHLNEPLHILVEAELPIDIIDARLMHARDILEELLRPMDESQDIYKKQQLRELALLNGTLREDGSASPMSSSDIGLGLKRAKTSGGC